MVSHQAASAILAEMARISRTFRVSGQHAAGSELSGTKLGFLQTLATRSTRPSELAARLVVSMPVASRAIDSLETDGLVARERDPEDGRAVLISITAQGRQVLADREATAVDAFAQCLSDWSETESAETLTLLQRLNGHLAEVTGVPETSTAGERRTAGAPTAGVPTAREQAAE